MSGLPFLGESKRLACRLWLVAVTAVLAGIAWQQPAGGATLQELLNGASITAGNSQFSDWQLISSDATSGVLPNLSFVTVTPLATDPMNPGLQYATAGQFSVTGINAIDLLVKFRVSALGGGNSFTNHSLSMTGITFSGDGGISYISNEVLSNLGTDLGPAVVIADHESGVNQFVASSMFAPQSGMNVTTNVFVTGLSGAGSVNLTSFTQRFAQNGAPVLAGDYNKNGIVDAADYVVWRKNVGPPEGFSVWKSNFGDTLGGSGSISGTGGNFAAIPEPASIWLMWLAFSKIAMGRNRKTR